MGDESDHEDINYDDYGDNDNDNSTTTMRKRRDVDQKDEKKREKLTAEGELALIISILGEDGIHSLPTSVSDVKVLNALIRHVIGMISTDLNAYRYSGYVELRQLKFLHALKALNTVEFNRLKYLIDHRMWSISIISTEASRIVSDAILKLRETASVITNIITQCEQDVSINPGLSFDTLVGTMISDLNKKAKVTTPYSKGLKNSFCAVERFLIEHALYLTDVCLNTNGFGTSPEAPIDALEGRISSNRIKVSASVYHFRIVSNIIDRGDPIEFLYQYRDAPATPLIIVEMINLWLSKHGIALTVGEVGRLIRDTC